MQAAARSTAATATTRYAAGVVAINGNRGDDTGLLGAGDDSFTWDPGDGSDKVEGEAGTDTMVFNGAGVAENFDFSASSSRLKFFRDVANITMDVDASRRAGRSPGARRHRQHGVGNTYRNRRQGRRARPHEADAASRLTTVNGSAGNDTIRNRRAGAVDMFGLAAA